MIEVNLADKPLRGTNVPSDCYSGMKNRLISGNREGLRDFMATVPGSNTSHSPARQSKLILREKLMHGPQKSNTAGVGGKLTKSATKHAIHSKRNFQQSRQVVANEWRVQTYFPQAFRKSRAEIAGFHQKFTSCSLKVHSPVTAFPHSGRASERTRFAGSVV
jgi:hypothetical protein